jgi:N-acetyl-beta-hexosaminidase
MAYTDPFGTPAVYTEAQLRHVSAFARARGVRIMVEVDLPGHISGPLCGALPSLCVRNRCAG